MSGGGWRSVALALGALARHWRRHPGQLVALAVGLAAATALWTGVQALNAEARRSYDQAAGLLGGERVAALTAPGGALFDRALFAKLRRAGWPVSPLLEGQARLGDRTFRVIGLEPVTLPARASLGRLGVASSDRGAGERESGSDEEGLAFLRPPWRALMAPAERDALGLEDGARPMLEILAPTAAAARASPPIHADPGVPPGTLVMDVGAAERLLGAEGRLSRLLLDQDAPPPILAERPALEAVHGGALILSPATAESDLGELSDSFHLNLTAFGALSFIVGLFIAQAAISLAFEQRRGTLRTLRALGVSARAAATAILGELLVLALLAGALGVLLGYLIAAALAPGVSASLQALYGAPAPQDLAFRWSWAASGLAASLLGALLAGAASLYKTYRLPLLAAPGAEAWRAAQARWLGRAGLVGAVLLAASLALAAGLGRKSLGLYGGFLLLGALLSGAALLAPALLAAAIEGAARAARRLRAGPATLWFLADARRGISGLALALSALMLAMAVNIGVGAMVGGFRGAFLEWLDARLTAAVYLHIADPERRAETVAWAQARPEVRAALPNWRLDLRLDGAPVTLRAYSDDASYRRYWRMLAASPHFWDVWARGGGVLVSEQLARKLDLSIGSLAPLPTANGPWRAPVLAVYADYGNPKGQASLSLAAAARFSGWDRSALALAAPPEDAAALLAALRERFALGEREAIDQTALKRMAAAVFERTFDVTAALSALTFAVAGIALFASLAGLSGARLAQLAPLWALGLTRRRLAALDLAQTAALALGAALLAIPLGLALTWGLVAVVNVEAFGWRLPLRLFPEQWLRLAALALGVAALAAAPGYWRLRRAAPERLLRLLAAAR